MVRLFNSQNAKIDASATRRLPPRRERWVGLTPEGRYLWALDGIEQAELRLHHAWMGLVATEFRAHRAMQLDEILNGEVVHAAVNR